MQSCSTKPQRRAFAAVSIDRTHEQNKVSVKGDGGAVGFKPYAKTQKLRSFGFCLDLQQCTDRSLCTVISGDEANLLYDLLTYI